MEDAITAGNECAEFHFRAPTEAFLPRAVVHFQWKPKRVEARVHCLVKNRRRDFRVGEVRVDRECQLDQTCALLVKIRAAAGEPLHDQVGKISLEMPEVMRGEMLNEQ